MVSGSSRILKIRARRTKKMQASSKEAGGKADRGSDVRNRRPGSEAVIILFFFANSGNGLINSNSETMNLLKKSCLMNFSWVLAQPQK